MRALVVSTFSVAVTAALTCVSASAQISDAAAIAADPPYTKQTLVLTDIPEPSGPAIALFNGTDLSGWDKWIGYRDPALTYHQTTERALGKNTSEGASTFRVVEEDGKPALYVEGKLWGALVHKGVYGNYHLRMQYKWGSKKYAPRQDMPENNGLLYHSYGKLGSVFGTWMPAVEFEIMRGSVGMAVQVGQSTGIRSYIGHDADLKLYPYRRYQVGGALAEVGLPTYNVEAASDAERPTGQWNTLDLYVLGDRAVHVVNGVPVLEVHDLAVIDSQTKTRTPLTKGHIQLQSEGAETFFRDITIEPISSLPKVEVK